MVYFKLAYVRDNVLMRHKNCRQRHIRHCHGSCVVVTWVMGHKIWPIVSSVRTPPRPDHNRPAYGSKESGYDL